MKRTTAATITVTIFMIAGCGGSGDEEPLTAREFADCIRNQSVLAFSTSKDDLDLVAADAGDGGIYVDFGKNSANVAVERSNADAERTEEAYKVFTQAFDVDTSELLHRRRNSVWLYDKSPTDSEASAIDTCTE